MLGSFLIVPTKLLLISSFYVHLSWFLLLSFFCFTSLFVSLFVSYYGCLYFSFSFLSSYPLSLSVRLFFDVFSCWFLFVVLFISSVIIVYSYFYISPYKKSNYFLVLTVLFVLSMCLVIVMSDLFFLMLGWDGLGLVSFFLIVYYQNQSSIFSGIFTLLMNRFGDGLFICTIALYSLSFFGYYVFSSLLSSLLIVCFLVLTFITKRAIFPFSPWLPMAIAAPTPISALVHSSTLVTSGLYLLIKFRYIIYSCYVVCFFLASLCLFTSFYAGLNTIFEKDLKKLIALSTLRHLGFIGLSFSLGLLSLSFFHLLSHALFKSLLFIAIGDIIINLGHSQDIRFLSSGSIYTPFSSVIMLVPILNLLGVPRLVGFFSKDLVLEAVNFTFLRFILYVVLLINLVFTFYYSFQLFYYSFSFNKFSPYSSFHSPSYLHSFLLLMLRRFSLVFGFFFLRNIAFSCIFIPVPLFIKFTPFIILGFVFVVLCYGLSLPTSKQQLANSYFSSIMFLYFFMTKFSSNLYYSFSFSFVKNIEIGFLNSFLNSTMPSFFFFVGSSFLRSSKFNPLYFLFFCLVSCSFFFV